MPAGVHHIAYSDADEEDAVVDASHYTFREQLITHYTYAKAHGKVEWLVRGEIPESP